MQMILICVYYIIHIFIKMYTTNKPKLKKFTSGENRLHLQM